MSDRKVFAKEVQPGDSVNAIKLVSLMVENYEMTYEEVVEDFSSLKNEYVVVANVDMVSSDVVEITFFDAIEMYAVGPDDILFVHN